MGLIYPPAQRAHPAILVFLAESFMLVRVETRAMLNGFAVSRPDFEQQYPRGMTEDSSLTPLPAAILTRK